MDNVNCFSTNFCFRIHPYKQLQFNCLPTFKDNIPELLKSAHLSLHHSDPGQPPATWLLFIGPRVNLCEDTKNSGMFRKKMDVKHSEKQKKTRFVMNYFCIIIQTEIPSYYMITEIYHFKFQSHYCDSWFQRHTV